MKHQKSKEGTEIIKRNNKLFEDLALGIIMNKTKTNETVERGMIMKQLKNKIG